MTEVSGLRQFLVEPPRPDLVRRNPRAPWFAVATICVGAFLGQLDASIVTVALPDLHRDLNVSLGAAEWVSLAYLLVLVSTVLAVGRVADMAGRKLLYTYGFVVFTLASLGCGLAPNLAVLLVLRGVQALGAAMLQANSVALIRTTVSPGSLRRAIGVQGAAQALGLALGPAVGGLLVGAGGWRWVFYVNLPIGILGTVLGWLLLPRTRVRAPRAAFDWTGLATLLPASTALLLALSLLGRDGPSAPVVGCAVAAAALFACFVAVERRARKPLIELGLLRERRFAATLTSGLLAYLVLFGVLFVTPLYLQAGRGLSPAAAGLSLTVLPAALGLAAMVAPRLGRTGPLAGLILLTAACAVLAAAPANHAVLVAMLAVAGSGLGLFTPANNAAVAGRGRPENAGMVSGLLNMTRGIGTSLGVAVGGASYLLSGGDFRATAAVLAAIAFAATLLTATTRH